MSSSSMRFGPKLYPQRSQKKIRCLKIYTDINIIFNLFKVYLSKLLKIMNSVYDCTYYLYIIHHWPYINRTLSQSIGYMIWGWREMWGDISRDSCNCTSRNTQVPQNWLIHFNVIFYSYAC